MAVVTGSWVALNRLPRRVSESAADAVLAGACFAAVTLPVLTGAAGGHGTLSQQLILGILVVLPIIVRRRLPAAAAVGVAVVLSIAALTDVRFTPWVSNAGPAFAIVIYTVALRLPRRQALSAAIAAVLLVSVLTGVGWALSPHQDQDAVQLLVAVPAWAAGQLMRTRRAYHAAWQDEVHRREQEREARIRAEERLRVSRDVHDVVSHTLSVIAVQAGVARLLLDRQPAEAAGALTSIEQASRSALTDLRQVLTQLRSPGTGDEPLEPSLLDLPALVTAVSSAALDVRYRVLGEPRSYPPLVETAVYRIAQEALTNVVKHAQARCAEVEVRHEHQAVVVAVCDDGTSAYVGWSVGFGLTGMRERAELLGGTFECGASADGGFSVLATLPFADAGARG